uniref:Myotubularin phosphatase domain-containing protein n=1 Tax=Ascaris lumbricoides TaxID=6252 RepID=A0A0M3HKY9_ASCLU
MIACDDDHFKDIRKQLLSIMDRHKLNTISCGRDVQRVQKAICSGFFRNAAKRDPQVSILMHFDEAWVVLDQHWRRLSHTWMSLLPPP